MKQLGGEQVRLQEAQQLALIARALLPPLEVVSEILRETISFRTTISKFKCFMLLLNMAPGPHKVLTDNLKWAHTTCSRFFGKFHKMNRIKTNIFSFDQLTESIRIANGADIETKERSVRKFQEDLDPRDK